MSTETIIHVLGDGITGTAVKKKVNELEEFVLGPIEKADYIIASPGIPPHHYPKNSAPIISELEFAYRLFHRPKSNYKPKLICTTGTNGKTTLTSLLSYALNIPSAGNIGTPLISFVDKDIGPEWIAVEASSYQLYSCSTFQPTVAIMLPITNDHLTWHKAFTHYVKSKANIFKAQTHDDYLIYPLDCNVIQTMISNVKSTRIPYSIHDPQINKIKTQLVGNHNKSNMLAAIKAIESCGLMTHHVNERLSQFEALPHRLEKVYDSHGIRIYNDSKATNPDSTIKAIESFSTPIRLIMCGDDKGLDYNQFMSFLHDHVSEIIVFGGLSSTVFDCSKHHNPSFKCSKVVSMTEAIHQSVSSAQAGDIILFSPSSSSFDLFSSYIERGNEFKKQIEHYFTKQTE